jgi:hypothetical protein
VRALSDWHCRVRSLCRSAVRSECR